MKKMQVLFFSVITFILIFCCNTTAFAESVRGQINSWGTNWMAQDTNFGSIWKATLTSGTTRTGSEFKYDQDGIWNSQWGLEDTASNATVNSTIGKARKWGDASALTFDETSGNRYTFTLAGSSGDNERDFTIQETSGDPTDILTAFDNNLKDPATGPVTVSIQLAAALNAQEQVWVCFTTNNFTSRPIVPASGSATNYTATVPGEECGARIQYYILTSTMPSNRIVSQMDLCTLRGNKPGTTNYYYRVGGGNCWHIPTNAEPSAAFMRNPPTNGVDPAQDVFFYNGVYTGAYNQTGGTLYHRKAGDVSWTTTNLQWDSNSGNNQYWVTAIPGGSYAVTNEVEYYLEITFSDNHTTYLGTTNDGQASVTWLTVSNARAHAFLYTYGQTNEPAPEYGNSWHYPTNAEPSGAFMRNPPTNGMPPSTDVYIYNGTYTNDSDQTGGTVFYRQVGTVPWLSTNLSFDQNAPSGNQYWKTFIPGDTFDATNEVEYYLKITYNNADTTYLGTTNGTGCIKYPTNSVAATNTFTYTYGEVSYNLGNCWHVPANYEPPGAYMRNPRNPYSNNTVYIYNGNQSAGDGNPGDQSGGTLYYRLQGAGGGWTATNLDFDIEYGNNKFWKTAIPAGTFGATNVVEYYLSITYNDHDTTYLGTTNDTTSETYGLASGAQGNPFSYTYGGEPGSEAGFLWHNTNRVSLGNGSVQFWLKIGYAQGTGTNRWVDNCVLYYTTNGLTPSGTNGTPGANTVAVPLSFNHMEEDTFEQGDAMWWDGTVSNLPSSQGSTIKYKIGAWNSTGSGIERFAEYNTEAEDNKVYEFSLYVAGASGLQVDGVNADYTTTKFFINEAAGETAEFVVHYQPETGASNVQVFCNVNRRDLCDVDYTNAMISADGYPDGINPPDGNYITPADTGAYFTAFAMTGGPVDYYWTCTVSRCGAYRLTARYQKNAAGPYDWNWYSSDGRRDHAVVVSPRKTHALTMYELNTLTVEAESATENGRSTFRDLLSTNDVGGDPGPYDPFNLEYLDYIQANCLWFQPIHPSAGTDRGDPEGYTPGSPYATRDYFAVSPYFGAQTNEESALAEFTNFVYHCDHFTGTVGTINIMLDGVFNHTSWDAEMGQGGVDLGFCTNVDDRIGWFKPHWYSLWTDYGSNATYYHSVYSNDIATAPDRGDFGKWDDVADLFFGRYSALVRHNPGNNGDYLNEDDVYDFAGMSTNTMDLWKYFAYYTEYWLEQTGHSGSNSYIEAEDDLGIDGLRCDFGQGLPPQCWEWIINSTRKIKWNFIFMAETLDGGKPGYRSNRHFDVLNEDMVFKFTQAHISESWQFRQAFEDRREAYNGGAVLLNLTGHDEVMPENDAWMTASRYGAVSTVDGIPMIFYGQAQGIQAYLGNETSLTNTGFERFELNFGKYIPNFKQWNKLTVWNSPPANSSGLDQWYGRVNWARHNSPALRSRNRYFLQRTAGGENDDILAVAKYQHAYGAPDTSDVVLAFALILDASHTPASDTYDLQGCWNLLGLDTNAYYNVRNLASSDALGTWLWATNKHGSELWNDGIWVNLPADDGGAITRDGALVQYLKIDEVGAPTHTISVSTGANGSIIPAGNVTVTNGDSRAFTVAADSLYRIASLTTNGSSIAYSFGNTDTNYIFTWINVVADGSLTGAFTSIVTTNTPDAVPYTWIDQYYPAATNFEQQAQTDTDDDQMAAWKEYIAGTDPTNASSVFRINSIADTAGQTNFTITVATEPGKRYVIEFTDDMLTNHVTWSGFANTNDGIGRWIETNTGSGSYAFVDDFTTNTTDGAPARNIRYYKINVDNP